MYSLRRLKQEAIETWTDELSVIKLNQLLKNNPNKSSQPDSFTGEFYQTSSEELTLILLKLIQKIAEEGMLSN